MLADNAWESPGESGALRQTWCQSALFCRLLPGSPPAACRRSAPPLTGEVKEIKWNIPSLILPNALWHPHSAETRRRAGTKGERQKQIAAARKGGPTPRDACSSFTLMSPDRRGLVRTTFNKLWRMFWVAIGDSTKGALQRKPTKKLHKISVNSAFISYKSVFIARCGLVSDWSCVNY